TGDGRRGQGLGGHARRRDRRAGSRDGGPVGQGDDGLAQQGGITLGGEVGVEARAVRRKGLQAGGDRRLDRGRPFQIDAGGGRAGARVAQHGDEQGGGAQQQQAGAGDGDRRLLQDADRGRKDFSHGTAGGRGARGGGEKGLALGEHGQGLGRSNGGPRGGLLQAHNGRASVKKA